MVAVTRKSGLSVTEWLWIGAVVVAGYLAMQAAVRIPAFFAGDSVPAGWLPLDIPYALRVGDIPTSGWSWGWFAAALIILAAAAVGLLWVRSHGLPWSVDRQFQGRIRTQPVDQAAKLMATPKQLRSMSRKQVAESAARLVDSSDRGALRYVGLPIATAIVNKQLLWAGFEDLSVDFWGPRQGKTTARIIPAIAHAPGSILTTSNKADVVHIGVPLLESRGVGCWVFDPSSISGRDQGWWWNPLEFITDHPGFEDSRAEQLAMSFASATVSQESSNENGSFRAAAIEMLGNLFLAAALDFLPITVVNIWLSNLSDDTPITILRGQGFTEAAAALEGQLALTEKTRDGVVFNVRIYTKVLTRRHVTKWITNTPGRIQFTAADFADSHQALFLLSKDRSAESVAELTTALMEAVFDAWEKKAERCGGRLPVPALAALDEVANVVSPPSLPEKYSHYGSRGIIMMSIFQEYSQGVRLWGRDRMDLLFSAASVVFVGGAIKNTEFLGRISQLIGTAELPEISTSRSPGRQQTSVSSSYREKTILSVADLAALPENRAVVLSARKYPVLVHITPYFEITALDKEISAAIERPQR